MIISTGKKHATREILSKFIVENFTYTDIFLKTCSKEINFEKQAFKMYAVLSPIFAEDTKISSGYHFQMFTWFSLLRQQTISK